MYDIGTKYKTPHSKVVLTELWTDVSGIQTVTLREDTIEGSISYDVPVTELNEYIETGLFQPLN